MNPTLYFHPFSSYSMKALIALEETETPFAAKVLADDPVEWGELARIWPLRKFPVLTDGGRVIAEASIIVEHVDRRGGRTPTLIPAEAETALVARMLDRVFDNYVETPMQTIVGDALRPAEARDPHGVQAARDLLDRAYAWIDGHMRKRTWATGESFSLADCAAAPALFYADWVHPISEALADVRAYRARLNARPSFARCIEAARPYRHLFPPGAPDRD